MRRSLAIAALIALTGVSLAVAYQAVARERDYGALLARGDAALGDEQTFEAIEAYSGAIALRPDSMLAHLRRGETYQRRGELDEAARDFRTAAALDPTATRPLEALGDVLYQLQRFERAAEIYERDLRVDNRSAEVSYKLALARYRQGNFDGALETLTETVRLKDSLPDAHYLMGLCLREKRQQDQALRALERAVILSPGFVAAREELADLYGTEGRRSDEIEQLQMLAALDRDRVERQVAVGLAHARAGHHDVAVVTLGNALERAPDQPLVYRALGQVWLDVAESRNDRVALSKALEALSRIATDPEATSDVLTLYGRALLQDGQLEAAERTLQLATTRYPIEPTALVFYATAAERQAHFDAARRALVEFHDLVSDDRDLVEHATRIAAWSVRLNDPPTAVRWLNRASATTPNDVRLIASLADAQLRSGDRVAAQATIARGLEKDPRNALLATLARRAP